MAGLRASAMILLLAASATAAAAGPLVPPSEQPGRERYRFTPSPLDRCCAGTAARAVLGTPGRGRDETLIADEISPLTTLRESPIESA